MKFETHKDPVKFEISMMEVFLETANIFYC